MAERPHRCLYSEKASNVALEWPHSPDLWGAGLHWFCSTGTWSYLWEVEKYRSVAWMPAAGWAVSSREDPADPDSLVSLARVRPYYMHVPSAWREDQQPLLQAQRLAVVLRRPVISLKLWWLLPCWKCTNRNCMGFCKKKKLLLLPMQACTWSREKVTGTIPVSKTQKGCRREKHWS